MKTEKNAMNRELIYEAARKLFYEKGFNEATFSELGSMVGVHRSLITYYFKTKNNLASQVLSDFIANYTSLVREALINVHGEVDPVYESALRVFVMFNCFAANPPVARFYTEFCDANPRILYRDIKRLTISQLKERFELPFDEKHLKFIQMVDDSSREALTKAFFSGNTDLSLNEAIELKVKLLFQMFNLPEEYINEIYVTSKKIYDAERFIYGPGFLIRLE